MGCCPGFNKNIIPLKDILIIKSDEIKKKEENLNAKEPNTDIQGRQKTDKEEIKKEKSSLDNNNQNVNKNDKDNTKREKKLYTSTSSKTNNLNYENNLKVNKNKIIKKGSQRVQHAINELKLLSLKEINNDKKKFFS